VVTFGYLSKEMSSEVLIMQSFGHTRSFRHNLNRASKKKKNYFTKVVQFGLSKEISQNVYFVTTLTVLSIKKLLL
jgi:hypothetical protein